VLHLPTPDLWDTITAQLLRSSTREPRATAAYRRWAVAYGTRHDTPDGPLFAIPRPEQIPDVLPAGRALRGSEAHLGFFAGAALLYQRHHSDWAALDARALAAALRQIRGLGRHSATMCAADYTGDHSVYEPDEPTLRAGAYRAAHGRLPQQQRPFTELWQRWTPQRRQRHALTVFCLAHSSSTRTPGPRGIPARRAHRDPQPVPVLEPA
jgi:3-methyladenine DNA glycosylase/8-oxoguanine DNA glycosylase